MNSRNAQPDDEADHAEVMDLLRASGRNLIASEALQAVEGDDRLSHLGEEIAAGRRAKDHGYREAVQSAPFEQALRAAGTEHSVATERLGAEAAE